MRACAWLTATTLLTANTLSWGHGVWRAHQHGAHELEDDAAVRLGEFEYAAAGDGGGHDHVETEMSSPAEF